MPRQRGWEGGRRLRGRLRARCAIGLAALAAAGNTRAFESYEHIEMANLALQVAIGYESARPSAGPQAEHRQAIDTLQFFTGHYGQVAACVDYFLYPEKMLAFAWKPQIETPGDGIPRRESFPLDALERQCRDSAAATQASHSNHAHFQQDLMVSLRVWHAMAIGVARGATSDEMSAVAGDGAKDDAVDESNLFGALFINAISDHYLQDFFAPGHLVTPRDIKTDLPATAMHDQANDDGAWFRTGRLKAGALRDVLLFLCTGRAVERGADHGVACVPTESPLLSHIGPPADRARALQDMLSDAPADYLFRGDTHLFAAGQLRQRLLLLAVEAQSVLDVVHGTNTLHAMRFSYDRRSSLPTAQVDFGRYVFPAPSPPAPTVASAAGTLALSVDALAAPAPASPPLYQLRSAKPIVFVSDTRESQSTGHFMARNLYTVGFGTGSWQLQPPDGLNRLVKNWLGVVEGNFSFGALYYKQGGDHGRGVAANLAFTVPETDSSIGPYYRFMTHQSGGHNVWRSSGGLRIETSFTDYFTFFLTGGFDYSTDPQHRLVGGRTWGGGLRIAAPVSRIPVVSRRPDKLPDPVLP